MNLKEQLQADLKTAMFNKDELRKNVIRFTLANLKNAEIAKIGELTEAETLAVLSSEVKRRRDTIAELEKANRPELLKEEQDQLDVLMTYLPKQLSREEIAAAARQVIAEVGASGPQATGEVMKRLMPELKGKADGKLINEVVRELLQ
jgi:uncharacterized protein YqeY